MEIGILTYYGVHNHGAVLQANALKTVLVEMGHEVHFLTFDRSYEYIPSSKKNKYKLSLGSLPFFVRYTFEKGISNVLFNYKKRRLLNCYREESLVLDTNYSSFNGDCVVVGSDEVFSLEIGYNPMMYGYGLKPERVISYAGSFGPTTIEEIEKKGKVLELTEGLRQFSHIAVRDNNSKEIIKQLCNRECTIVCDPVILYGYKNEINQYVPKKHGYIVIYAYDNRMNESDEVYSIRQFAKENNLKTISVGYFHKWCDENYNATPNELLGWIKNADLTITDTFHGSVMSLICNTPMVVKLRGNANKLAFLLREYDLSDRILDSFDELAKVASKQIDFSTINSLIREKREKSRDYLQTALTK